MDTWNCEGARRSSLSGNGRLEMEVSKVIKKMIHILIKKIDQIIIFLSSCLISESTKVSINHLKFKASVE
jgi:hypothetical protein